MEGPAGETTRWIERADLADMVERDVPAADVRSFRLEIEAGTNLPVPVSGPEWPGEMVDTYEVRQRRWQSGGGPQLSGMDAFVHVLRTSPAPVCVARIDGEGNNYLLLFDATATRVLALVAIAKELRG